MTQTGEAGEVTMRGMVQIVRQRIWIVAAVVVLALLLAVVYLFVRTPIYEATSELLVIPRGQEGLFDGGSAVGLNDRAIQTEIRVIEGAAVRARVAEEGLEVTADEPEVSASAVGDTDVIAISVRDVDPEAAAEYADAFAEAYIAVRREQAVAELLAASSEVQLAIDDIEAQLAELPEDDPLRSQLLSQLGGFENTQDQLGVDAALATGGASILRPAEVPDEPVEPQPFRVVAIALGAGLIIGLGIVFLLRALDRKIRTEQQLGHLTGQPVLAAIPDHVPPDRRPITISDPTDPSAEAYRSLATSIEFLALDHQTMILEVTSSVQGEGKSSTAVNAAVALADNGHRVLLVDADLRRPTISIAFALAAEPGFTDVILGKAFGSVVHSIELAGGERRLHVLTCGRSTSNPSAVLGGVAARELLAKFRGVFDIVVLDSAPILPISDSVALAGSVDAVVVVAEANRITDDEIRETVTRLERVSAPIVGVVLNRARGASTSSYSYGYTPAERR